MPDSIDASSLEEVYDELDSLIENGVTLLDELAAASYIAPEWWLFVDLRQFDLQSTCSCVLAQLPAATDPALLEGASPRHAEYDTAYTRELTALTRVAGELDWVTLRHGRYLDGQDFGFDAPQCAIDGEIMNARRVWAHMQGRWEEILRHRREESADERLRHPSAVSLLR